VGEIKQLILRRFDISDKELKDLEKDIASNVLVGIKEFLSLSLSEEETAEVIETN